MKFFLSALFFLLIPGNLISLELFYTNAIKDSWITISAEVTGYDNKKLYDILEKGQKAEIKYQLRLYNGSKGFFSIFGNKLIFSKDETFLVHKDFFFDEYIIEKSDKTIIECNEFTEFQANFFKLTGYQFYKLTEQNSEGFYLLCRVTYVSEKLEPPLQIISFLHITTLLERLDSTSDWREQKLMRTIGK